MMPTPFDEASQSLISLALCRLILAVLAEHLQLWGALPTAEEFQRKMQRPGL
jgi:hypothetical protein